MKQYVLLRDGRQAAIKAGYAEGTAADRAYRLLRHPAIKREVAKQFHRIGVQYERQLAASMQELFFCVTRRATDLIDESTGKMLPLHEMPERINAAIDGYEEDVSIDKYGNRHVKKKVKLVSKATSIDMAMKIIGAYSPEKETTGDTYIGSVQQQFNTLNASDPRYLEWLNEQGLKESGITDIVGKEQFPEQILGSPPHSTT